MNISESGWVCIFLCVAVFSFFGSLSIMSWSSSQARIAAMGNKMTNQEIVTETKYCEENGLDVKVVKSGNYVVAVQCIEK